MSANPKIPKDDSKVSSERISSMQSTNQLSPPYPQTLRIAQLHGDRDNPPKTKTSSKALTGSTGRSSSARSADEIGAYQFVGRGRGKIAQENYSLSAVGFSPMSRWEHGSVRGEPWSGVGEVAAGATDDERSVRWSQSKNHGSEKDSDRATKGSSNEAGSGS